MNAVVWLGTAIFFTFGAEPACFSSDMRAALKIPAESYYFGAIADVVMTRYYYLALACAVVALLHLLVEWLYQGRPGRKFSFYLLLGLFVLTLVGSNALQPTMFRLNKKHFTAVPSAERQSAARTFRILHVTSRVFNVLIVSGLVVYTWRVGSPSDTLRFVRPVQFRG
jgi:Domain of unknown function (DUF4149)